MHAFRTATCGAVASRVGALGKTPFADFASAGHKDVLKGVLFETTKKAADFLCSVNVVTYRISVAFIRCGIIQGQYEPQHCSAVVTVAQM